MIAVDIEEDIDVDLDLPFDIVCEHEECSVIATWRRVMNCCGHELFACAGHKEKKDRRNEEIIHNHFMHRTVPKCHWCGKLNRFPHWVWIPL